MRYSKEIDKKQQDKWKKDGLYKYNPNNEKEKFYTMEMLPYPSGAKLHYQKEDLNRILQELI